MHKKQMSWTKLIVLCCACVGVFVFAACRVGAKTDELKAQEADLSVQLTHLRAEQSDMEDELKAVGSDAYIEDKARTDYQYLKPGEIRYEITNPEALYGTAGEQEASAQTTP